MSSFSCPHLKLESTYCLRLKIDCVPGRNGCVLNKKFQFAVPAEDRIKIRKENQKVNKRFQNL